MIGYLLLPAEHWRITGHRAVSLQKYQVETLEIELSSRYNLRAIVLSKLQALVWKSGTWSQHYSRIEVTIIIIMLLSSMIYTLSRKSTQWQCGCVKNNFHSTSELRRLYAQFTSSANKKIWTGCTLYRRSRDDNDYRWYSNETAQTFITKRIWSWNPDSFYDVHFVRLSRSDKRNNSEASSLSAHWCKQCNGNINATRFVDLPNLFIYYFSIIIVIITLFIVILKKFSWKY